MKSRESSSLAVLSIVLLLVLLANSEGRGVGGGGGGGGGRGGGRGGASHFFAIVPVASSSGRSSGGKRVVALPLLAGVHSPYKAQKSTSYSKREGSGMSAWGILALILGLVGTGTLAWFCYMIGVPLWRDRQMRNRPSRGIIENLPLQETPSTATPSP